MKDLLQNILKPLHTLSGKNHVEVAEIYPCIALAFLTLETGALSLEHETFNHILQINYCRKGHVGWKMENGNSFYLRSGDFSLHSMDTCAFSSLTLPAERYEGLTICIDLERLTEAPPEILAGTTITGEFLLNKFCPEGAFTPLAGNETTERIFSALYAPPKPFWSPWQKIKILELLLYLGELKISPEGRLTEYQSGQIETIHEIHDLLTTHMEQRFTIEALSKQYLMNPTTLKSMFKSVYGTSLAAHIKEHRMEKAAKLLRETDLSIAEIALQVGYDSQSKFTSAFKTTFGQLPKLYRKQQ